MEGGRRAERETGKTFLGDFVGIVLGGDILAVHDKLPPGTVPE